MINNLSKIIVIIIVGILSIFAAFFPLHCFRCHAVLLLQAVSSAKSIIDTLKAFLIVVLRFNRLVSAINHALLASHPA